MAEIEDYVTEYGVQPFVFDKRKLKAEQPRAALSEAHARRMGERLAGAKAGVVVYQHRIAPLLGDYDAPTLLATHGAVPAEVLEQFQDGPKATLFAAENCKVNGSMARRRTNL